MARARSGGGGNGSIWGLVVFGAGFFICLVLAILFYTKVESAEQAAEEAQADLAKVANSSDLSSPDYADRTAEGSGSGVSKLMAHIGDQRSEINSLQNQVTDLTGKLTNAVDNAAREGDEAARARANEADAVANRNAVEAELRSEVQALTTVIDGISEENTRLKGLIDKSVVEIQGEYEQQLTDLRDRNRDLESTVTDLERNIDQQRRDILALIGERPEAATITQADATIVAQIPDQNRVYLDIGWESGVKKGMTFSVHDPDALVKLEEDEFEGKAVVEIINVSSNTAVGRITTSQPRAVIRDGDALVNLIFDPNRVYSFHVFGQFDLDYDQEADDNGLDQVESMVTRFNGKLADNLGFATDYLVLGLEPQLPARPQDELDLIKMREFRVELENFQAYQDRIAQARELGIPVLNQNRFLDLVGYYQR